MVWTMLCRFESIGGSIFSFALPRSDSLLMFDECPQPASNAASPSKRTTLFIFGVTRCHPTLTSTCWITFHIKPLRFHCSLLCVSPAALVARAISRYCRRFVGVQGVRQRRHEYFPSSWSSRASAQVPLPSVDTSTRRIP